MFWSLSDHQLDSCTSLSSTFPISPDLLSLLDHSPSFIPTPSRCNHSLVFAQILDFLRKLHWYSCSFTFSTFDSRSLCRFGLVTSSRWPPSGSIPPSIHRVTRKILSAARSILFDSHTCYASSNLSDGESSALLSLCQDPSVLVLPSDKGGRWTILDSSDYDEECRRLLSDSHFYRNVSSLVSPSTLPNLHSAIQSLLRQGYINKREVSFLIPSTSFQTRSFRVLPKLHKSVWPSTNCPPGRPIVSDVNSESSSIARMIDFFLFPIVSRLDSFLLDSRHLISLLQPLSLSQHSLLCTLDVRSLYTNVPITEGIHRVSRAFSRHPDPRRPDSIILELLQLSLSNNDFSYVDTFWLQTSGVAMGKAFGGAFAGIYLGEWEAHVKSSFPLSPRAWFRFQDDIFMIWDHSIENLHRFTDHVNACDPNIQVDLVSSDSSIRFLDLLIQKTPSSDASFSLDFSVAFKDSHSHLILSPASHHARHVTPGVIFSQILRWATLSSTRASFDRTSRLVFPKWRSQSISRSLIRTSLNKVYRLTNFITHWSSGFDRCGSPACGACRFARPSLTFRAAHSSFARPISYRLSCESRNTVYLIQCLNCPAFYVGHSSDYLRSRMGHHLRNIANSAHTQVASHFNGNCTVRNFSFVAIDRTLSERALKTKEEGWIRRLQATKPPGLNSHNKTKADTLNLVTMKAQCTETLNGVVRRACSDAGLPPVRLCYKTDKNLKSLLRR